MQFFISEVRILKVYASVCMCEHVCIETNGLIFLQIFSLFHCRFVPAFVYYMKYRFIDFNSIQHDEDTSNFLFPFSRLAKHNQSNFYKHKKHMENIEYIQWDFVAVAHSFYKNIIHIFNIQYSSPCVLVSETVNVCVYVRVSAVCSLQYMYTIHYTYI